MLGGRVAREVFEEDRIRLPDRRVFMEEVNRTARELHDAATTRAETDSARRRRAKRSYRIRQHGPWITNFQFNEVAAPNASGVGDLI